MFKTNICLVVIIIISIAGTFMTIENNRLKIKLNAEVKENIRLENEIDILSDSLEECNKSISIQNIAVEKMKVDYNKAKIEYLNDVNGINIKYLNLQKEVNAKLNIDNSCENRIKVIDTLFLENFYEM